MTAPGLALVARDLTLDGPWGPVFGPINLDTAAGGVTVIEGSSGSGRTSLLLALSGRLKPSSGSLNVFGRTHPRDIFKICSIAGFEGIDELAESVTVRDLITEQIRWDAPWYKLIGRAGKPELSAVCTPVFGDHPLPRLGQYVSDLGELEATLLRIAVANTKKPAVLVIDDLEQVRRDSERAYLVERLADLGRHQTIICSTVNPLPDGSPAESVTLLEDVTNPEQEGAR
ncbi:ATP-binding cassette domain-containing protein [Rhodococcus sp. ARC_M6]|uniref:ATP-binding cassette domain-containing protein n=1 Tax=Rhodococcus sp. ARC_M6 TaxID=2928852 RepID=UPI001FB4E768|nr:ATP-binding cassette domain-containing protein [Rhodococcus sp. ARC_M6]MCJ0902048.1 ATP-binding cassette domain-containing protein [Rhodococcus sp. ARC_M6]